MSSVRLFPLRSACECGVSVVWVCECGVGVWCGCVSVVWVCGGLRSIVYLSIVVILRNKRLWSVLRTKQSSTSP